MATVDSLTGDRTLYDGLIKDIAGRFGLGTSAGPLVQEVVNMITGSPGGVAGFIDKFKAAGLGSEIGSWLGNANAAPLSAQQLTRVIGPSVLGDIGSRLGLGASAVSTAVGYILPKLIGILTPGGTIPGYAAASEVHAPPPVAPRVAEPYIQRAPRMEQVAPRHLEVVHDEPHMTRWLWPLLGALAILGLGSYFLSRPPAPVPTVAQAPVVAPAPPAPLQPARLTLSNEDGIIHYSGSVHDEDTRNSIVNSLKAVFGADKIQGDIGIDLNRAAAPWLVNLRPALDNFKMPGVQAAFDGNSVNLGGVISDSDRERISSSLRNVLGSGMVFGTLSDRVGELASDANTKAVAALSSLKPGYDAKDLTNILNQSVINFPPNGAELPATATGLLQNAAAQIKQLPPSTMLEIAAYTDNTGDPAANVTLSQRRADAVRNELIKDGDNPAMLVAKGYGAANPIANNDLLEGRYRNRRVEYHVINKP